MNREEKAKKWVEDFISKNGDLIENESDKVLLEKLSAAAGRFEAPHYDVEAEWARLEAVRSAQAEAGGGHRRWVYPLLRVAAVFVLMFLGYYLVYFEAPVIREAGFAQRSEVLLPDSSDVILNAGSSVRYIAANWDHERRVKLRGEAFFKVKKGSKFSVETAMGTVTVLGTQFNVRNWGDWYEVSCYEGSVRVSVEDNNYILVKGQKWSLSNGKIIQSALGQQAQPSWIAGESEFHSIPLLQVLEELGRQYNIDVDYGQVNTNQLFTGKFVHDDIDLALKSIVIPSGLTYRLYDQKVILSSDNQQ